MPLTHGDWLSTRRLWWITLAALVFGCGLLASPFGGEAVGDLQPDSCAALTLGLAGDGPPGTAVVSDQPFDILESLGWVVQWNERGLVRVATDPAAPHSPPDVVQFQYPRGYTGGAAPGTPEFAFPPSRRLAVTTWWKSSPDWQGHLTGSNKLAYVFATDSEGSAFLALYGTPGGPYEIRVYPQFSTSPGEWLRPNADQVPVTIGEWHRLDWALDEDHGAVRWWLDGQLVGDYCGVPFPDVPLGEFKLAPVWGGAGDMKEHDDFFWFDHVIVRTSPPRLGVLDRLPR